MKFKPGTVFRVCMKYIDVFTDQKVVSLSNDNLLFVISAHCAKQNPGATVLNVYATCGIFGDIIVYPDEERLVEIIHEPC